MYSQPPISTEIDQGWYRKLDRGWAKNWIDAGENWIEARQEIG
jgi:hypothetical protein